jgi:adenylate kinase family enzyme
MGSWKKTMARKISAYVAVPQLEVDSVFHQPGWQELDRALFRARVTAFPEALGWVVDGNYSAVRDVVWSRADTVIWLDPPRHRVMRQVIWRTLRRMATRAELWNGNREPWRNLYRLDPTESIIAWAWTSHHRYRERYAQAQADPANGHLTFIRLRTAGDLARLLRDPHDRGRSSVR